MPIVSNSKASMKAGAAISKTKTLSAILPSLLAQPELGASSSMFTAGHPAVARRLHDSHRAFADSQKVDILRRCRDRDERRRHRSHENHPKTSHGPSA